MDYKLIKDYGEDILSYRIRTARQKKRMRYEDFDKKLIRIEKERRALNRKKWNLGWEPLIPSVQKGWKRFFVLNDDVARGKHAAFYENILKKINTYDWSYRKDFKIKRRKFGRKIYVVKPQKLLQPYDWQFARMNFTDVEKQLFHTQLFFNQRHTYIRYVFNEPWRFVLRVRPNMIDKVKIRDHELESMLWAINDYMDRNRYYRRLHKLLYGYGRWSRRYKYEKNHEKNPLKNKPLHEILDAAKEEIL